MRIHLDPAVGSYDANSEELVVEEWLKTSEAPGERKVFNHIFGNSGGTEIDL